MLQFVTYCLPPPPSVLRTLLPRSINGRTLVLKQRLLRPLCRRVHPMVDWPYSGPNPTSAQAKHVSKSPEPVVRRCVLSSPSPITTKAKQVSISVKLTVTGRSIINQCMPLCSRHALNKLEQANYTQGGSQAIGKQISLDSGDA